MEETFSLTDKMFSIPHLKEKILSFCEKEHLEQAKKALAFAEEKHALQFRKPDYNGKKVPYLNHPLMLACHALSLGFQEESILSACLLHDVCEDCGVKPEELPVDNETRKAVCLLTKAENFDHSPAMECAYYESIAQNRTATLVKILDRCHNISSMGSSFRADRIRSYMNETRFYIYPLLDQAEKLYPEYTDAFFLIRYHMNSVLNTLQFQMKE